MDTALASLGVAVAVVARDGEVTYRDARMAAYARGPGTTALDAWLRDQAARASQAAWVATAPDVPHRLLRLGRQRLRFLPHLRSLRSLR
ncbi:MAG: hypothetical protein FJX36_12745 [Alphaproteobacteria bacterium]|nr:hypothetical protein [Alphaproteobacteria bacterium]